jgi:hypothetical protein
MERLLDGMVEVGGVVGEGFEAALLEMEQVGDRDEGLFLLTVGWGVCLAGGGCLLLRVGGGAAVAGLLGCSLVWMLLSTYFVAIARCAIHQPIVLFITFFIQLLYTLNLHMF